MAVRKNIKDSDIGIDKKEKVILAIAFFLVLIIAAFQDLSSLSIEKNTILRSPIGEDASDVNLLLEIDGIIEDYAYELEVAPVLVTKEEAADYFRKTKEEIDADFKDIQDYLPIKDNYLDNLVCVDWLFSPAGYVQSNGKIVTEKISEDGVLITVSAVMTCGNYEEIYTFPYRIFPEMIKREERIKTALDLWFKKESMKEGVSVVELPQEIEGYEITWKEEKDYLFWKVFLLEGIALLCIWMFQKKEKEDKRREKIFLMEIEYPEIVGQLQILMEAGMTIRQAWDRIAYQYVEKRRKAVVEELFIYEEIVHMNRRIAEGEKERAAYHDFGEKTGVACYRGLMRLLLVNLEKGNKDICKSLEEESRQAYEQRILLAKKLGEEASTKMLVPLMFMMLIVMLIVMAPAVISFAA